MAVYPAPMLVLAPALVVNLALAGRAAWLRRTAPRAAWSVGLAALFGALVLAAGTFLWFDTAERRTPVFLGLALGALLGVIWEWACPSSDADPAELGPMTAGLAVLCGLGLALDAGVASANAALALLAAWAVPLVLKACTAPEGARGGGLAIALVGLAGGAVAWGARLTPHAGGTHAGPWPLALGLATLVPVGLALSELAGPRRCGVVGAAVAGIVFALGGALLAGAPYQQPTGLILGLVAGAVAGVMAAAWLPTEEPGTSMQALLFLVVAGILLVVENRLMGILAIGMGGVGLAVGAGGRRSPRPLVVIAVAIFAARVWLQLFLDRTNLTGYGVDLTHPYAFAALILGGLLPTAALAVGKQARLATTLAVAWALALALLPAWLGYLIHVEALGGLLAGLLLAAFAIGAHGASADATDDRLLLDLVPPLLLQTLAVTMLAAPWLVSQMNAPRDVRVHGFLVVIVLAALGLARWWWAARQTRTA